MFHKSKRFLAAIVFGALALVAGLMTPAVALADHVDMSGPQPRGDTVGFLFVLFCVALAVILLCRSSNRSPEVRVKGMDEE